MADDHDAFRSILDAQESAWAAGDAAAFAQDVTDDVVFTNVVGRFSVGRAPFEEQHAHIFATFYKGSTMRQRIEHVAILRPDVAVVNSFTELTGFGPLPPGFPAHGDRVNTRLQQMMVRADDGWHVAAFHNVVVNPNLPGAAPPAVDRPG